MSKCLGCGYIKRVGDCWSNFCSNSCFIAWCRRKRAEASKAVRKVYSK